MRRAAAVVAAVLLVGVLLGSVAEGSRILEPESLREEFTTPLLAFSPPNVSAFNASIELFPVHLCVHCDGLDNYAHTPIPPPQVPTVWLNCEFTAKCFHCGYERMAMWAMNAGYRGVLLGSSYTPGYAFRTVQNWAAWAEAKEAGALMMIVSKDVCIDVAEGLASGTVVEAELAPSENPWQIFYDETPYWTTFQVVCSLFAICGILVASYKLYFFVAGSLHGTKRQPVLPIPVTALAFVAICEATRLVYMAVDPGLSRLIFSFTAYRIFVTLSIPLQLFVSTLMALSWLDAVNLTRRDHKQSTFLSKPAAVFLAVSTVVLPESTLRSPLSWPLWGKQAGACSGQRAPCSLSCRGAVGVFFIMSGMHVTQRLRELDRFDAEREAAPRTKESGARTSGAVKATRSRLAVMLREDAMRWCGE